MHMEQRLNVLGTDLMPCCTDPMTGFYRNGNCDTGPADFGRHTVCVVVTEEFLSFSKERGNDLTTPFPEYAFPGLKPGDKWCLCATRWVEAYYNDAAPQVILQATHAKTLDFVPLEVLIAFAIEEDEFS